MTNKSINQSLNKIYIDADFSKRYGQDIYITVALIIVLLGIALYFHTINNLKVVRANWSKEKCNPTYFPFVPIINPDPNLSAPAQIASHMKDCITNGIKYTAEEHMKPFFAKFDFFGELGGEINKLISMFYGIIKYIFSMLLELFEYIIGLIHKIFFGITRYLIKIKSIIDKLFGVVVTNFFILLEIFNIGMAVILNMATITSVTIMTPMIATLLGELVLCVGLALMVFIPFIGWIFAIPLTIATISAVGTLVLIILVGIVMAALIHIQNRAHQVSKVSSIPKPAGGKPS